MDAIARDLELFQNARLTDLHPDTQIRIMLRNVYEAKPCVYFVRFGDYIKIGWSNRCSGRFEELDIYPEPLEVLLVIPGDAAKEKSFHRQFASLRHRKEIFRHESELRWFIEDGRRRLLEVATL
jgi:hypothetical protein